jgi:hypothetical protein
MPEWLSNIGNIIGFPGIIAGMFASFYVFIYNKQNRIIKKISLILIIFMGLFVLLRFFSDSILIHWGLGVPYWGEAVYSENFLNKIPESQREIRIGIHDLMWLLTFRIFPVGFLILGFVLTFLSSINKSKNKFVHWSISGLFGLFTIAFLLTVLEQFLEIYGRL